MKQTQCDQILHYLRYGGRLTPLDALHRFGCSRLAARVNDLRKAGHPIHSMMVEVLNARGDRVRVAQYRMEG